MIYPTITPFTKELDDTFRSSKIINLTDHMPQVPTIHICVGNQKIYKKNTIINLFENAGIDYKSKIFVSDSYFLFDDFEKFVVDDKKSKFIEFAENFKKYLPIWEITENYSISKNLTFMSNKVRPHRIICATVLANLFNIDKLNYTYENIDQYSIVNSELLIDTDYDFDVNKTLPDRWVVHSAEHESPYGFSGKRYKNNHEVFADCLYKSIYHTSATSLITEPNFYEHGCMFTEKTLMSIYSGHFMIWAGGWKSAETAKRIGIDIFDDVIDHGYQYIEHPGARVVEAILKNLDFLKNVHLQQDLRNLNILRLKRNLELVRNLELLPENIRSLSCVK